MIRLEHVSKQFQEGERERWVLTDVEAAIGDREIAAIVGRSGSGKSTLLNLLAGLDRPTGGAVYIGETFLSALGDRERTLFRRNHIGFVFQFFNLIPTLSVRENVALTAELRGWGEARANEQAERWLDAVGLFERRRVFPDKLSGGEQQRVAIARALCADPELILADEPTGNLDAETGAQVLDLLTRLARAEGRTLVMVTHSPEIVAAADRVYRLDHGRIAPAPRPGSNGRTQAGGAWSEAAAQPAAPTGLAPDPKDASARG